MTITSRLENWAHPALTVLPWEHTEADRIGVHGVAVRAQGRREDYGPKYHSVDCYCGWTSGDCATNEEAFEALVGHALQAREGADVAGDDAEWTTRQWETVRVGWEVRHDGQEWVLCGWDVPTDEMTVTVDLRREDGGEVVRVLVGVRYWVRVECREVSHLFDKRFW